MSARRPSTSTAARFARRSIFVSALVAAGCVSDGPLGERPERDASTRPSTAPAPALLTFQTFAVRARPPEGWTQKTNSISDRAEHITWLSPSGNTAYGVVFFRLPFPVGHEFAFSRGFVAEVRKREGEPYLIDKHWDDEIGGLRFTVRSPRYQIEAKFFVKGLRGYAVYAGSLADRPVDVNEFLRARAARESTRFAREIKPGDAPVSSADADE